MNKNILWLFLCISVLTGCAYFAVQSAPKKSPSTTRRPAAEQADALFWKTLHGGQYDQIPVALNALTAAYIVDPGDATTAAHIGWLHVWRIAERTRMVDIPATITDHAVMGRRYFEEAVRLNPKDARYLGFYGGILLAEGSIHQDEKLTRKGYFTLMDSIKAFPEFNYFTAGYVMSERPRDSKQFNEGLEYQWLNLDVCVGEKVNRHNPDYQKYMHLKTDKGQKRVCWNSWIAPHNLEGFFLNMGDMLVKAGDWQTAQKIYANARFSDEYNQWKFRDLLEERITQAETNVTAFNAPQDTAGRTAQPIMFQSAFSCMGCHQE
ncbi:MAG: hypothetical protein HY037_00590 [Nitrospirae bacterium]|nr:hypothetical protein [Candidatus Troglogloeales bacterium]